jgi:hypothetical protein
VRRNLNEINTAGLGQPESLRNRHDTKLPSSFSNYAHLGRPNLTVDAHPVAKRRLRWCTVQNVDEVLAAGRQQITALFWIWCKVAHACDDT